MSELDDIETVTLSEHAEEHLGTRFFMPRSQIKKIVKTQSGMVYHDEKHDSYIFQYGKTAICVAVNGSEATVTTLYRTTTKRYRMNRQRWRRIN